MHPNLEDTIRLQELKEEEEWDNLSEEYCEGEEPSDHELETIKEIEHANLNLT